MSTFADYMLSAQRALLGNVTSNMRAVMIGWEGETIYVRAITFEEPREVDEEILAFACTEIGADFPRADVVDSVVKSDAPPVDLLDEKHRRFVFFRSDEDYWAERS